MTSDCSRQDGCDVPSEQPALHVEGAFTSHVEEAAAKCQPSAHFAGPAAGSRVLPPASHREWRLPSVPSSVRLLRWGLRAFLEDAGRSQEELEDLVLATCEATTNAVEHAQHSTEPFFDVATQIIDNVVTILVRDYGRWRAPTSSPYRGRGLATRVLADTNVAVGAHGTTVTLRNHRSVAEPLAQDDERAS